MKLCITSQGRELNSALDSRFGRCRYLIFVDENGNMIKTLRNPGEKTVKGAGIKTAQAVADKEAGAVITGKIGPNAAEVLKASGIKIYTGISNVSIREAIDLYKKGSLKEYNF